MNLTKWADIQHKATPEQLAQQRTEAKAEGARLEAAGTDPTYRPINCRAHEVLNILERRQVQLRRPIAFPRSTGAFVCLDYYGLGWWPYVSVDGESFTDQDGNQTPMACPFGKVGDRLWVRETWASSYRRGCWGTAFRADMSFVQGKRTHPQGPHFHGAELGDHVRWRSSTQLPRWASRITLEVTDIRVQRLQDISRQDAIAEGCGFRYEPSDDPDSLPEPEDGVFIPRINLSVRWDSTYPSRAWETNPWVWAATFDLVTR